jgi:hypothetical protein
MVVVGNVDKGELDACNHRMEDSTDADIGHVEVASLGDHNVAFAAFQNRVCSPQIQKVHQEHRLEMEYERPFFGDPLKGNSFFPAEERVDCYSKAFLLGFGPGSAAVI